MRLISKKYNNSKQNYVESLDDQLIKLFQLIYIDKTDIIVSLISF